jgi:hypothetical protein
VEKENELRNARLIYRQELVQKGTTLEEIESLDGKIVLAKNDCARTKQNATIIEENKESILELVPELARKITEEVSNFKPNQEIMDLGELKAVMPAIIGEGRSHILIKGNGAEYPIEIGESLQGNRVRLQNFFDKFDTIVKERVRKISELKVRQDSLKAQLDYSSNILARIGKLEKELEKIFKQISIKK